ncbi:DUF742 domain-containing protein [Solihabitans fulvus]|uniref:DUF742 domain-containing protein n=1 Tax=Solihabitans fulvus TaxID=1892852 RepID=A0A5B2XLQ9_9PSEU|nr:DUF742 domain-containing protein [Solihabitans fulvus]KAA2264286.1 DUF742 domain-containing protein [Solihabitans fulvus]
MSDEPRLPDPRMIPVSRARSWFAPYDETSTVEEPVDETVDDETGESPDAFVRPFIVTGGRTRPLHDGLRVDTLVGALPSALSAPLAFEGRRIVELCQTPKSVAEIAAGVGVPLGVARVLIADLVAGNLLTFRESTELPINVIERIRDLVRAL